MLRTISAQHDGGREPRPSSHKYARKAGSRPVRFWSRGHLTATPFILPRGQPIRQRLSLLAWLAGFFLVRFMSAGGRGIAGGSIGGLLRQPKFSQARGFFAKKPGVQLMLRDPTVARPVTLLVRRINHFVAPLFSKPSAIRNDSVGSATSPPRLAARWPPKQRSLVCGCATSRQPASAPH
jgi:hypothetical protein